MEEVSPTDARLRTLLSKMRTLNERQRKVVCTSLGYATFTGMGDDRNVAAFIACFKDSETRTNGEVTVQAFEKLEGAIVDAYNEKVLEPCVEELKTAVDALTKEERRELGYSSSIHETIDWREYQRNFITLDLLKKITSLHLDSLKEYMSSKCKGEKLKFHSESPNELLKNVLAHLSDVQDYSKRYGTSEFSRDVSKEKLKILKDAIDEFKSFTATPDQGRRPDEIQKHCPTLNSRHMLKRFANLPPCWRAYIYGKMRRKDLAEMAPDVALCLFFREYGDMEALEAKAADVLKEDLEFMNKIITEVEEELH
jgi:hypothetical protein